MLSKELKTKNECDLPIIYSSLLTCLTYSLLVSVNMIYIVHVYISFCMNAKMYYECIFFIPLLVVNMMRVFEE